MSLQGNIDEMGLGAIIQTLSLNRYRGTLRIETEEGGSQFFFISEGEIILVRQVKRDPVRLGDLLIRAGKIDNEQLDTALAEQRKHKGTQRLGKTLVTLNMIEQDEIEGAVREKFEEDFLDLFLLDKGRFEFIFGLTPESLFGPEEKLERVSLNSSGIMLEAMKRIDEWEGIIQSLGSLDTIYRNRMGSLGPKIEEFEFESVNLPVSTRTQLYELLDGDHTLRDVISTALRDGVATRLETFLFLHQLNKNELVKPLDFKTLLGEAKKSLSGGDVPATAKYIRAILCRKEKLDIALIKRYLEFLKKYKRPRLAFDEARRFAAQALADDETDQAIALYEMAIALDRNVEVIDRLFYALLRANKRDRAIQVGLELREFLSSESDLSVAIRLCKNLKELDPKNPEVLEFNGLILKRQERNEEAIRELDQALARMDPEHPRRPTLIAAILALQPDRNELRDERASLELQAAEIRLRREVRRRWLFVLGSVILVVGVWRAYSEYRARVVMTNVRELIEAKPSTPDEVRRVGDKLQEVLSYGYTTVRPEAEGYRSDNEKLWADVLKAQTQEEDTRVKELADEEKRRKAAAAREKQLTALRGELETYDGLKNRGDLAEASSAARKIDDAYGESFPEETKQLRIYVELETQPEGCAVYVNGKKVGTTPYAVPVPVDGKLRLRLALPGYKAVEQAVTGKEFTTLKLTLEPGPTWRLELTEPPMSLAAWSKGVVLASRDGRLSAHGMVDGSELWTHQAFKKGTVSGGIRGLVILDRLAVATFGTTVVALRLADGKVSWTEDLGGALLQAPAVARRGNAEVLLLVGGQSLTVLDPKGQAILKQALPAPAIHAAVAGPSRDPKAFVALEKGLVGVALSDDVQDHLLWTYESEALTGRPIYSKSAEAVLAPSGSRFVSLGEERGELVGSISPGFTGILGTALSGERFSLLAKNGFLCTLSAYNGNPIWAGRQVAKGASAGPLVVEGDLVLADATGGMLRFARDGRPRKTAPISLGAPVDSLSEQDGRILAVVGKTVYLVDLGVTK